MARFCTRRFAAAVIASVLLLVLIRMVGLQGWLSPWRIQGGSMAVALTGRHFQLQCADCGRSFACGVEYPPTDGLAVCPNCGYAMNRVDDGTIVAGRRVVIDRFSYWLSDPQPWQVVAFRSPDESRPFGVKRVVAVGARRVEIRQGDVYVDGAIQRKDMRQLMALRIPVHDDIYRSTRHPDVPRWQGSRENTRWRTTRDGYVFEPSGSAAGEEDRDWLVYQQWTCWPHPSPPAARTQTAPILDHYGYNQNVSRGALNSVHDFMVSCRLQSDGVVTIRLSDGYDTFDVRLSPSGRSCRLRHNGAFVREARFRYPEGRLQIDFALCDRQVLFSISGRMVIRYCFERSAQESGTQVIAFSAEDGRLAITAPAVFRDVHYLGPGGVDCWSCAGKLPGEGIFVLGDNVPISEDSREWADLAPSTVLGRVYPFPRQESAPSPMARR